MILEHLEVFGLSIFFGCATHFRDNALSCSSLPTFSQINDSQTNFNHLTITGPGQKHTLEKDVFEKYTNVCYVGINGAVNKIEPGAFKGLVNLKVLVFEHNELEEIEAQLFDNTLLYSIYIGKSKVKNIQAGAFDNLPNLKSILVCENYVTTIKKGVFTQTNVEAIHLNHNKIKNIDPEAFAGMKNLQILELSNNQLQNFDANIFGNPSQSLEILLIDDNKLTIVEKDVFYFLPNLKVLNMTNNFLHTIGDHSFVDSKSLWLLDLSHNQIGEIRPDIFPSDSNLTSLYIQDNNLTYISPEVLMNLPNLKLMSFANNPWQCSCQNIFKTQLKDKNVKDICETEMSTDATPDCIDYPVGSTECIYDLEKSKPLISYFRDNNFKSIHCYTENNYRSEQPYFLTYFINAFIEQSCDI